MGQSTLYPMLYNLEAKKLIASRWQEADPRPRKYYRISDAGRDVLRTLTAEWFETVDVMQRMLGGEAHD